MTLTKEFDTIAAISTPVGEGAIAIVRLTGSVAIATADRIFVAADGERLDGAVSHSIHYGHIVAGADGRRLDEVMVSVMRAPATFTREDVVEINTHGGVAVTQSVLQAALRAGARLAEPGEFTKRAFLNGRIDLAQAESVMDLIRSKTDAAAQNALRQLDGGLSSQIAGIRQAMLETLAAVEVNIDYPEYDGAEEVTSRLLRERTAVFQTQLKDLLATANRGKILREGLKTAIIGRPNVGKSSLLNQLLREDKAIVTEIAGTTRDSISEYAQLAGLPLELIDTAGIHATDDLVEKLGVARSERVLAEADLVLLVLDASQPLTADDQALLSRSSASRRIILLNKSDLPEELDRAALPADAIPISALTADGLSALETRIGEMFQTADGGLAQGGTARSGYLSNSRHIALIEQAAASLVEVATGLDAGLPVDLVQVDLTQAWQFLGEIVGDTAPDALITQLFSQFCLGK